jgi:WD40 repeat protein
VATPLHRLPGGPASLVGLAWTGHGPVVARSGAGLSVLHQQQQPSGTAPAGSAATANRITSPSSGAVSVDLPRGRALHLALRAVPSALALGADGQTLAVGARDGSLRCWSLVTGTLVGAASQLAPITALALGPDGRSLASADAQGTVHLWHLPGGRPLQMLAVQAPVVRLALAADGRRLAAATQSGRVQVWDLTSQPPQVLHDLRGPAGALSDLAWAPDGQSLAACTHDGVVWLRSLVGASATGSRSPRARTGPPRPKRSRSSGTPRTTRRPAPAPPAGGAWAALGPGGWLRHWLRRVPSVL